MLRQLNEVIQTNATFEVCFVLSVASSSVVPVHAKLPAVKLTERTSGGGEGRLSTTGSARSQIETTTESSVQFRAPGDRDRCSFSAIKYLVLPGV